ncbi:MAG: phage tail sheath C-terminal domain-containing protein, partial [Oscillospiraceae bacterium]
AKYVERAFEGSDLGGPSMVLMVVLGTAPVVPVAEGLKLLTGKTFDYLAPPPDVTAVECTAIADWVKAARKEYATVKAVLPETAGDDKGLVNFTQVGIQAEDKTPLTSQKFASRIAGILAGIPSDCSGTGAKVPEVVGLPIATKDSQDAAIKAGKLILTHDGTMCRLGRAVNSLQKVPATGKEDWKKIKVVEAMDLITYYLRTTIEGEYRGHGNSYSNKLLLLVAVATFLTDLEAEGILLPGSGSCVIDVAETEKYLKSVGVDTSKLTDQQIREADTGSNVYIAVTARILDAMEDFAVKIAV